MYEINWAFLNQDHAEVTMLKNDRNQCQGQGQILEKYPKLAKIVDISCHKSLFSKDILTIFGIGLTSNAN